MSSLRDLIQEKPQIELLLEAAGLVALLVGCAKFIAFFKPFLSVVFALPPKKVDVELTKEETEDILEGYPKFDPKKLEGEREKVYLWDPSTFDYFGEIPAMSAEEVKQAVQKARIAQKTWRKSSFTKRRELMRTMLRYITENQETCAQPLQTVL
eukprot:gene25058-31166_t